VAGTHPKDDASRKFMKAVEKTGLTSSLKDLARVERQIKQDPKNPLLYSMLGRIRASRREHEEACSAWRTAIRLSGRRDWMAVASLREDIAGARRALGQHHRARREYGYAASAYRRARKGDLIAIMHGYSKVREAHCLAEIDQFDAAARLVRSLSRSAGHEVFEEEIRTLRERWPALASKVGAGRAG
jgi:tetratricopeptide (TPR) repeat protein